MSKESERLFQAMNDISDEKIDESAGEEPAKRKAPHWRRWTALAAALALVVGMGRYLLPRMGGSAGAGAGTDGASAFMSYAGPVFPLTLGEENAALTAVRDLTLDFAPWVPVWVSNEEDADREGLTDEERQAMLEANDQWFPDGGYYQSATDILVTDSYVLTNSSDQEQVVDVLYPFVSALTRLEADLPALTLDGQPLDAALYAGGYSGGFMGALGGDMVTEDSPGSVNLDQLNSWEEYKALLSDGRYLEKALGEAPDLTGIPVTVYKLTDAWGPEASGETPNPTIRVTFELDYEKTTVLSYGFHAASYDRENGTMGQGFSIREEGEPGYGDPYYLIVLGEDVDNMAVQGYNTGGWDTERTVEAGVEMARYETDLDAALREAAELMYRDFFRPWDGGGRLEREGQVNFGLYYGLLADYLCSYGPLSERGAERYDTGWLEGLDVTTVDRVFYLEAQIAVPAGGSVTLAASMAKAGSFDHHCAHMENRGVYGYDLVTQLGSDLNCTVQTATLEDRGQIEIVRQNFGFDLENGVTAVTLDPAREHYYLEVKRAEREG